jgi:putative ABC transport system permease protein
VGQFGIAVKLAVRQTRRQRLRTVAIIATLALPITVATAIDVVVRSDQLSTIQKMERDLGGAQALVSWSGSLGGKIYQDPDGDVEPAAILPEVVPVTARPTVGTEASEGPVLEPVNIPTTPEPTSIPPGLVPAGVTVTTKIQSYGNLVAGAASPYADVDGVNIASPPLTDLVHIESGRAPSAAGQVALTERLAHHLGVRIGGSVGVPGALVLHVVGIVRDRYGPRDSVAYSLPTTALAIGVDEDDAQAGYQWFLSSTDPVTWSDVLKFNTKGFSVESRSVVLHPPPRSEVPYFSHQAGDLEGPGVADNSPEIVHALIAGMVLIEIVLLAGPAFAVGSRRRRHELALVAASGGARRHLFSMVGADGLLLGVISAVIGAVVGIAAGAVVLIGVPHWTNRVPGPVTVRPGEVVGLASLAVLTGLLAALVPAVSASRPHPSKVLRGRQDQVGLSLRPALVGAVLVMTAGVLALVERDEQSSVLLVTAAALGEIGFALLAPAILALIGRAASHVPLWPRLALRDASRNRTAAAPAVAAILAVVAATVAVFVYGSSDTAHDRLNYQPSALIGDATTSTDSQSNRSGTDVTVALQTLRSDLPGATVVDLRGGGECAPSAACRQVIAVPPALKACTIPPALYSSGGAISIPFGSACRSLYDNGPPENSYLVDTGANIGRLIGGAPGLAAAKALSRGEAVVFDPTLLGDGFAYLDLGPGSPTKAAVRAVAIDNSILAKLYQVVIPPEVASQLHLAVADDGLYVKHARRLSSPELRAANKDLLRLDFSALEVERGYQDDISVGLLAVAVGDLILILGAAIVATALMAVDSREDLVTLAAVGAGPRVRRRLAMARAGIICLVGAAFGTLAGLLPGIGLVWRLRYDNVLHTGPPGLGPSAPGYPLSIPWLDLAIVALAAPLVATLAAALITRAKLPIERRRTS